MTSTPTATRKCARNLERVRLRHHRLLLGAEGVEGADIITTATADKQNATILTDNMVGAGVHINAVGGDCPGKTELHRDILLRSSIFVEYTPQTRIEGEIQQLPPDHPGDRTLAGDHRQSAGPARQPARSRCSIRSASPIEDFSALRYVRDQLARTGLYQELDLLADPDEPRDLFGMLLRAAKPTRDLGPDGDFRGFTTMPRALGSPAYWRRFEALAGPSGAAVFREVHPASAEFVRSYDANRFPFSVPAQSRLVSPAFPFWPNSKAS